MNEQMLQSILARLQKLEREAVRLRLGEVTDVGPLDVALGGADASYEGVAALGGLGLADGDSVAALVAGNDLLVLGAINGLRIVRGIVDSAGAISEGTGFTSVRNSLGSYTVTFATAFSDFPAVLLTTFGSGVAVAKTPTILVGSFTVLTFLTNTGANADTAFSFVAIGPG